MYLYVKESPVCWYDGLSCKLNDLLVIEGSIPFSPTYIYLNIYIRTVEVRISLWRAL